MSTASALNGMPSAATTPSAEPTIFQMRRPDTVLFGTLDGLTKQTGEPTTRLRRLMCKELANNALDASDAAGRPGQMTIEKRRPDTYVVADKGAGIARPPDDLAALFSIHRPMVSTKFQKLPRPTTKPATEQLHLAGDVVWPCICSRRSGGADPGQ